MSNLMNQARLKVLKARDDMITVRDQLSTLTHMLSSYYTTDTEVCHTDIQYIDKWYLIFNYYATRMNSRVRLNQIIVFTSA